MKRASFIAAAFATAILLVTGCAKAEVNEESIAKDEILEATKEPEEAEIAIDNPEFLRQFAEYASINLRIMEVENENESILFQAEDLKYSFQEFTQDSNPELVVCETKTAGVGYFEIYEQNDGKVKCIAKGHIDDEVGKTYGVSADEESYYSFEDFILKYGADVG